MDGAAPLIIGGFPDILILGFVSWIAIMIASE